MNKRSAMFVAAGLVLSLLVAGLAMAMGVTGPSADAKTTAKDRKPVVETVTRTVTIHKKEKADDAGTVVGTTAPASAGSTDDGAFDDDGFEDDGFEDDDHDEDEDDRYEDEDHEDIEHEDDDD